MMVAQRYRALRERALTPSDDEVRTEVRGFSPWASGPSIVEPVGRAFLRGYAAAVGEDGPAQIAARVHLMDPSMAGFAMEGAGMGVTVRAGVEPWSRSLLQRFLTFCGERHGYMIYVGSGWALARLPQLRWPDFEQFDPLLRPLILDGYGFHEVFFKTKSYLAGTPIAFPHHRWPGPSREVDEVVLQGVGRGLWFVVGGDPLRFAAQVATHPERDHASLWAGVGLACSYAGGRDPDTLRELADLAGDHVAWLRQGASFAIEARFRSGLLTPHTEIASRTLLQLTPEQVSEVTRDARPDGRACDLGEGSYSAWRTRIAEALDRVRV